jgi:hypothetical protein
MKPRNVYIWYLGDDDKYGRHMDEELRNQLNKFGILSKIHFERIAVLPKQVREYGIPKSDEGGGYDIDALNAYRPDLFRDLLIDHVDDYFDEEIHNKVVEKFPESDINKMVNNRVKFLDDDNDEKEDEDSENE